MAFRLLLVMAMGLGAMYMVHLLAQDYNRIRRPVAVAARAFSASAYLMARGKRDVDKAQKTHQLQQNATFTVDWKRILSRDPFGCLQSLICQIVSGADGTKSREAVLMMDFLENNLLLAPAKIGQAFSRGLALRGATANCYNEYPFCLYSAKTMLRVLNWFTEAGYAV